jgi:hypothetical protein
MIQTRIAFFDIDWTLYDHKNKQWSASALTSIKELKSNGIKCFICTSRPYDSLKQFGTLDLGIAWDGYVSSAGGVAMVGEKYLRKMIMDPKDIKKMIEAAQKFNLTLEVVDLKKRKLVFPQNEYSVAYYKTFNETVPSIRPYRGEEAVALNLFSPSSTDSKIFRNFPHLFFFRYSPNSVDVTPVPHEKGLAIPVILEYFGFKEEESIGFGDDLQDISFCQAVGRFVCMGNGKDDLKAISSFVTTPVWDNGVENGLRHLGLLSKRY